MSKTPNHVTCRWLMVMIVPPFVEWNQVLAGVTQEAKAILEHKIELLQQSNMIVIASKITTALTLADVDQDVIDSAIQTISANLEAHKVKCMS